jgi:Cu/Ag efflux pump CusA
MTTVINNPGGETGSDSAAGIIVGVIIGIILIVLFIIYGVPALRDTPVERKPDTTNVNVTIPNPITPERAPTPAPAN